MRRHRFWHKAKRDCEKKKRNSCYLETLFPAHLFFNVDVRFIVLVGDGALGMKGYK